MQLAVHQLQHGVAVYRNHTPQGLRAVSRLCICRRRIFRVSGNYLVMYKQNNLCNCAAYPLAKYRHHYSLRPAEQTDHMRFRHFDSHLASVSSHPATRVHASVETLPCAVMQKKAYGNSTKQLKSRSRAVQTLQENTLHVGIFATQRCSLVQLPYTSHELQHRTVAPPLPKCPSSLATPPAALVVRPPALPLLLPPPGKTRADPGRKSQKCITYRRTAVRTAQSRNAADMARVTDVRIAAQRST